MITRGDLRMARLFTGSTARPTIFEKALGWVYRPIGELDSIHVMRDFSALCRIGAESNFPAALKRWGKLPLHEAGDYSLAFTLSRILFPSLERAFVLQFRAVAERRMAAIALAIRLYEVDHGHRPETLAELVPAYLPEVPADPFAEDCREIGYRPGGPKPVLYSVNVNGIDEDGKWEELPTGGVNYEKADLPFFLNGDRPRFNLGVRAAASAPAQRDEESGDVEHDDGDADEDEAGDTEPESGQPQSEDPDAPATGR